MALAPIAPRAAVASAPVQAASAARSSFAEALRDARAAPAATPSSLPVRSLAAIERAQRQLDDVLAQARAGRTFSAAELLALQAQAHRFSHTVELASKVVEQGAQTVKQAVNTPV
jgi:hypothetical protein